MERLFTTFTHEVLH